MQKLQQKQHGGIILGIIIGVLVGLAIALAVAMYVMKVPTPFNSKNASRTPAQDAAEVTKNKDWDPNAALSTKPLAKPAQASDAITTATPQVAPAVTPPSANPTSPPATTPAAPASAVATVNDAIEYYVQVGAFRSDADAHALRGKLALSNFEGKVVERDQSGQKVYRVRVGPYASQAASEKVKAGLDAAGFDSIVVRSQK